jgi:hypothetical protein
MTLHQLPLWIDRGIAVILFGLAVFMATAHTALLARAAGRSTGF